MLINLDEDQIELIIERVPSLRDYLCKEMESNKFEEFAEEFLNLFPPRKLPTGKQFKSNILDVQVKLKAFIKQYKYEKSVILDAARRYVEHAEQVGYNYIRTASYFIHKKGEGSDLADWCEKSSQEFQESSTSHHRLL